MQNIPCVILCGGKSSRMGEDKALLPFSNSNSLAQYQYDRLKKNFQEVYLSSKTNKFDFSCSLILDSSEIYSPIVALKSIFEKLNSEKIFIITVDNPLVNIESINLLIEESKSNDITVATTEKIHNLCGVFSRVGLSKIDEMIENDIHKVGYLLKQSNTSYIKFYDEDEFINLNDKDEYIKSLNIIS